MKHLLLIETLPLVGIVVLVLIIIGLILALYDSKIAARIALKKMEAAFKDFEAAKGNAKHWQERHSTVQLALMAYKKVATQKIELSQAILDVLLTGGKKAAIAKYLEMSDITDEKLIKELVEDIIVKNKLVWVRGKNHYKFNYIS